MKKLLHRFPTSLPVGKEEFNAFYQDIVQTYGYPDKPGYKELVASLIQHTKEDQTKIPKRWFANAIRKAQVNETAYHMIQEARQESAEQVEQAKQEATNLESKPVELQPIG